jgi:hypothetical protein
MPDVDVHGHFELVLRITLRQPAASTADASHGDAPACRWEVKLYETTKGEETGESSVLSSHLGTGTARFSVLTLAVPALVRDVALVATCM